VPRIVAGIPEAGIVGAQAVRRLGNLQPPGSPQGRLGDEEHLHAASPRAAEFGQDDPLEIQQSTAGRPPQPSRHSTMKRIGQPSLQDLLLPAGYLLREKGDDCGM